MSEKVTTLKDSGARHDFATGSRRDSQVGKASFDLIPWHVMWVLAMHYERGSRKYGDRNWEKGQPMSQYLKSALRHLFKYVFGYRDEDHLTAAIWNLVAMKDHEMRIKAGKLPAEIDDLSDSCNWTMTYFTLFPDDLDESHKIPKG